VIEATPKRTSKLVAILVRESSSFDHRGVGC
jgi:hypothetical protein